MDKDTLVEKKLDDTRMLLEELSQGGFPVAAAVWFKASENGKWYFYLVSPLVDEVGHHKASIQLHPLIWTRPQHTFGIEPSEIRLIGSNDPIGRDALAAIQSSGIRPHTPPIRWGDHLLGNLGVDTAYVYPPPTTTP